MLFWILLGLSIAITLGVTIYNWMNYGDWTDGIFAGFIAVIVTGVVSAIILAISMSAAPYEYTTDSQEHNLQAIGAGDETINGRFYFLGTGYINGERVVNFIYETQADDSGAYSVVTSADGDDSRIFQDITEGGTPTAIHYDYTFYKPWIWPWAYGSSDSWDFHVPEGSIIENYTITND